MVRSLLSRASPQNHGQSVIIFGGRFGPTSRPHAFLRQSLISQRILAFQPFNSITKERSVFRICRPGRPNVSIFCHAPVGGLHHRLKECPAVDEVRAHWCQVCNIPQQGVAEWSHSWIFDLSSPLNSRGTIRAYVRFVGEVCRRFRLSRI